MKKKNIKLFYLFFQDKLPVIFFLVYFIIGVLIFRDYGAGWDELFQNGIGWVNIAWVFGGNPYLHSVGNFTKYYGPIYEISVFGLGMLFGIFKFSGHPWSYGNPNQIGIFFRHFMDFFAFFSGTICFFLIGKKIYKSSNIALLGTLFLILSPRIFADSFYNSKDTVFLAFFTIGIFFLIRFLEKKNMKNALLFSLFSAIAIDVRVLAVIIPFLTFVFFLLDWLFENREKKTSPKTFLLLLISFFVTALLVVAFMPYLWPDPIENFITMWQVFAHYPQVIPNLYRGHYVLATQVPWHYIPYWIFITTPPLYLVLFTIGIIFFIRQMFQGSKTLYTHYKWSLLSLLWFFVPLFMVIFLHSNLYNAWRQMFFIYPAFILITVLALVQILDGLKNIYLRRFFFLVIGISLLYTAKLMIDIHPYQNVYFNLFAGENMKIISQRFETDYWGLSYRKGLEYILMTDKRQKISISVENDPGKTNSLLLSDKDRKRLVYIDDPQKRNEANYYLTDYFNSRTQPPFKKVYAVRVNGGEILGVYKIK